MDFCGFTWLWLLLWVLENMHIKDNDGAFIRGKKATIRHETGTGEGLEEVS